MLEQVNLPRDVRRLNKKQKKELAEDIRKMVVELAERKPIHLGSNLGAIELTIALLSCFDVPEDKVFFDTGHQSYPFKILTGRKDRMETIRQPGGLAAFQDMEESPYDVYGGGHSGNSLSVALGMANGDKNNWIVPVIGDAAIANGLAFEAMNDMTNYPNASKKIIVVLNDNGMSISKTMGSLANTLGRIRLRKIYTGTERLVRKVLNTSGFGRKFMRLGQRLQRWVEGRLYGKTVFELLGMTYIGPVNGHNIAELQAALERAKFLKGPVLVHVKTKKGKLAKGANGVGGHFSTISSTTTTFSTYTANWLLQQAKTKKEVHVINPAMTDGTGYKEFAAALPEQYHDVGIAEEHALSLASGMALAGLRPYVHIYSTFMQRGFDQLAHDINRLSLPVTVLIDRAGFSAGDGKTHNGTLDVALLRTLNNFQIVAPSSKRELDWILNYSLTVQSPLAVRFANKSVPEGSAEHIEVGKWRIDTDQGKEKVIIAYGAKLNELRAEIANKRLPYMLINAMFVKPLDRAFIAEHLVGNTAWEVVEELEGGNGLKEAVTLLVSDLEHEKTNTKTKD